eukprot:CAMPEP_0197899336 /NCGR_PEP_ID=MMETSP1439-20131203/46260_1 /TAXON_ID=66791 /ORGANISM="Gonyaulax spinifera, Strain CCMP409" /LENGTH=41 /DNA_ID= /DNA_START= /DNA_END= /DNA_ORIENTATION=
MTWDCGILRAVRMSCVTHASMCLNAAASFSGPEATSAEVGK